MAERGLAFIDANVILRLLTGDDPERQARSLRLFKRIQAGELAAATTDTVISECLFVLTSPRLYHLSRTEAVGLLRPLLRLPHFQVTHRQTVLRACELYLAANLSLGDAYLAATMEQFGSETLYSYDEGFDRLRGIHRQEP